ncbi:MAG: HAMP domain-containing sensor histidine kinase [Oscillospiraceae bacterium]
MKKHKYTLTIRMFLSFLAFSALILIVMWLCQTIFLTRFYRSVKLQLANEAVSSVVSRLADYDDLEAELREISDYFGVNIAVYDGTLQRVACVESISRGSLNRLRGADVARLHRAALDNGGSLTEHWEDISPEKPLNVFDNTPAPDLSAESDGYNRNSSRYESLLTVAVVTSDSGMQNTVILNTVLTPLGETVDTLNLQLIYISIGIILLSLALSLIMAKTISRPIVSMNAIASVLASGDYNVQFSTDSGCREIDELANSLNYATAELSQVDRLRSELIANISHDLRTPLTMITGYGEIIRDIPGENTRENIDIIINEAKRLSALVSDVMDLSRYRAETQPLRIAPFSLTDTITQIIGTFSKFTEQEGYSIAFEHEDNLVVDADEVMIGRVIYNLIANSINYTGNDKAVRVRQLREGTFARIEVIDSGDGIAEEDLSHIFERYYRSTAAHVRPAVGTGLGLSIVKSALDAHGAPFGVTTSKGHGSVFWFNLKLHED